MQKMNKNFDELFSSLKRVASLTEDYLMNTFCEVDEDTKSVEDSMKYSLFAGGKRIRPYLTLESCKLFGGEEKCSLCGFCPVPLGLCIFIWIAIAVVVILIVVIMIAIATKKKKCPHCKAKYKKGDRCCPNCGKRIRK